MKESCFNTCKILQYLQTPLYLLDSDVCICDFRQNISNQLPSVSDCYYSSSGVVAPNSDNYDDASQHLSGSLMPAGRQTAAKQTQGAAHSRNENSRRTTPVLPRRMDKKLQLSEFASGNNGSSSSLSGSNSSLQTPVISDGSKDSSYSDEMCQLLPGGQLAVTDSRLDFVSDCDDGGSLSSSAAAHLMHCSSETDLVAVPGGQVQLQSRHHHGSHQRVGPATPTPMSAERAQQLRRRSRSADNLSRRKNKSREDGWSAVDIDINGGDQGSGDKHGTKEQPSKSTDDLDSLPQVFSALRLRPFRQQMNSAVVCNVCSLR